MLFPARSDLTVSGKRKIRGRQITMSPERIVLADTLEGLDRSQAGVVEQPGF